MEKHEASRLLASFNGSASIFSFNIPLKHASGGHLDSHVYGTTSSVLQGSDVTTEGDVT